MFKHNQWHLAELDSKSVNKNRYYTTPDGNQYPSVSTVVGHFNKKSIIQWRKRVGTETANKISTQASAHGTAVHKICEDYVNNKDDYLDNVQPANQEAFSKIKPHLDQNINNVYGVEVPLYSDYLKVAGRCDLACRWNNRNTIVDFKTASKSKKVQWIEHYFQQASMYAVMAEERTGIAFGQIVILIAAQDSNYAQCFVEKRDNFIGKAEKLIEVYYNTQYNRDIS